MSVRSDPRMCAALYWIEGRWTVRFEVNSETLRGSGRPLSQAVAVLVGCQPGERRVFKSPRDEIVISWPLGSASGPNLGSLKPDVTHLGGTVGDFVFLTLDVNEVGLRLLRTSELADKSPIVRLALLIGLSASAASALDCLQNIGLAIGIGERNLALEPDDVHAALMRRNEVHLAGLLREEFPERETDILERLESILGL